MIMSIAKTTKKTHPNNVHTSPIPSCTSSTVPLGTLLRWWMPPPMKAPSDSRMRKFMGWTVKGAGLWGIGPSCTIRCNWTTPSVRNWSKQRASSSCTIVLANRTTCPTCPLSWHRPTSRTTPAKWSTKRSHSIQLPYPSTHPKPTNVTKIYKMKTSFWNKSKAVSQSKAILWSMTVKRMRMMQWTLGLI